MDEAAPPQRVDQSRRGDEVAVENREQRQYGGSENQPRDPGRAERTRERRVRAEMLRDDVGPRVYPRDGTDDDDLEQAARQQCRRDGAGERAGSKIGERFL